MRREHEVGPKEGRDKNFSLKSGWVEGMRLRYHLFSWGSRWGMSRAVAEAGVIMFLGSSVPFLPLLLPGRWAVETILGGSRSSSFVLFLTEIKFT